MKRTKSGRWAKFLYLLLALNFLGPLGLIVSCSQQEEKSIGDRISAPFDILRIEKWDAYLLLSSAFDGSYKDGNLLRLKINEDGSYEKQQTVSVPSLGIRIAKNHDESILAVAFAQEKPLIKLFALDSSALNPSPIFELTLEQDRLVTDLTWFQAQVSGTEQQFLAVERTGNSKTARVDVFQLTGNSLSKLFTFPDDLPGARNAIYELGHSSPVYLPTQGLLVFFPHAGAGIVGEYPSPYEVLKSGTWPKPSTETEAKRAPVDLRLASLAAVDFAQYLGNRDLPRSTYFYPLMFNDSLTNGNKELGVEDVLNKSLQFRNTFTETALVKAPGCSGVAGDAAPDLLLAGQFDSGHVVGLTGWADFKAEIEKLKEASEKPEDRLILSGLKISPYSSGNGAAGLPSSTLRVTQIHSQNIGGICYPVVVRADVKSLEGSQTNSGRENVWVSHTVGRSSADPVIAQLPVRSASRFAGKERNLVFISFSMNSLTQVQLEDNQFTIGQTRSD